MSKVSFNFRSVMKELYIQQSMTTSDLLKLLRSIFQTKEQILGITDQFGKFYDLAYAAQHIQTLNNHTFNIVNIKDAADNISFGSQKSLKNQANGISTNTCIGIISDIQKFRQAMPEGTIVLITLNNDDEQIGDTPFYYFLFRGNRRWLEVWNDRNLVMQCEIGRDIQSLVYGVSNYLQKGFVNQRQHENKQTVDLQTKKTMILQAFDEIYRDGIINELQFYKKKVVLLERPQIYFKKYMTGETMDRSLLFEVIRADVVKTRDEARVFGQLSSDMKQQIPIIVRKSTNVIEKVTTEHTLTVQQEQILNLLLELQLKGLITETEMESYQKYLLSQNKQMFDLFRQYLSKEIDQIGFTKQLRRLFRRKFSQKKLILMWAQLYNLKQYKRQQCSNMKMVLNRQKLFVQMNQSLQRKYQDSFHFFQVKWINDLLDCSRRTPHFQDFVDMRIDIDNIEFLKRFYYYRTPTGKPEIQNRIKICAEYYAANVQNLYEYPMMIVTNTKSLFVRRAKRMKKIQAEVGSSDETDQQLDQNQFLSMNGSNFLDELSDSKIQEQLQSQNSQQSFEENCHQIYDDSFDQKSRSLYKISSLKEVNENEVLHLITEISVQNSRIKLQLDLPSTSKQTLVNIQNQAKSTKQSGISIIPIEQKLSMRPKDKKSGILSSYFDFMLDKQVSFNNLAFKFDNPAVTEYNSIHSANELRNQSKSLQRQKQERASRRQKIRQKAEQLLKRARKDEQIEHKY